MNRPNRAERAAIRREAEMWKYPEQNHRERMKRAHHVDTVTVVLRSDTWAWVQSEAARTNGLPVPTTEESADGVNSRITLNTTGFVMLLAATWEALRHGAKGSARYSLGWHVYYAFDQPLQAAAKDAVHDPNRPGRSSADVIPPFTVHVDPTPYDTIDTSR